jgi:hypothetical protein
MSIYAVLNLFGKPPRVEVCECERDDDSNMLQALQFINGDNILKRVNAANGRLAELLKQKMTDEQLYLWTLCRRPGDKERQMPHKYLRLSSASAIGSCDAPRTHSDDVRSRLSGATPESLRTTARSSPRPDLVGIIRQGLPFLPHLLRMLLEYWQSLAVVHREDSPLLHSAFGPCGGPSGPWRRAVGPFSILSLCKEAYTGRDDPLIRPGASQVTVLRARSISP